MPIQKQEFYEGAALHSIVRNAQSITIRYASPFFRVNGRLALYLKHSTRKRSPWGFTFSAKEQITLTHESDRSLVYIGLICGADGIASLSYEDYASIADPRTISIHIGCYRKHNEYYELNGPDGSLNHKVSPSAWSRVLEV